MTWEKVVLVWSEKLLLLASSKWQLPRSDADPWWGMLMVLLNIMATLSVEPAASCWSFGCADVVESVEWESERIIIILLLLTLLFEATAPPSGLPVSFADLGRSNFCCGA